MKAAILAGGGNLPALAAESLKRDGIETIAIVAPEIASHDTIIQTLGNIVDRVYSNGLGKVGKTLKILKKEGVTHLLMIGKFDKTVLEGRLKPDLRAIWLLLRLKNRNNDTIHYSIVDVLNKRGITTMSQSEVLKDIVPLAGTFTKNKADKHIMADIAFGYNVAAELGRLDVGQTVVIKKKSVMAVESAEGTDATIARGCQLANGGAVVVKAAKPSQDPRFDLPVVGMDSFKAVVENGGGTLAVEAGKTLIVGLQDCIRYADENGLIFMAFTQEQLEAYNK